MVFFTSILIVLILYYLQANGIIYVIIIAVVAELVNIFMTQTLTKSVEKKAADKFGKIANGYKTQIAAQKKTIKEFEDIQEESIRKIYNANKKIAEYEEKLGITAIDTSQPDSSPDTEANVLQKKEVPKEEKEAPAKFIDLPSGSNRKKLPF
ncbi:MAG: hypothetical protein KKE44_24590 [Proteobacteria bacterium]|nr:hypothetical protein [Pseudomonadota bacterium]MBU1585911.1 hypothetical protein [Pseudomonadota bacterium]